MRYNIKAFAAVCGLMWGLILFVAAFLVWLREGRKPRKLELGRFYPGYNASPIGSIFGLMWGLVDGIIGGGMFAWMYNSLVKRTPQKLEVEIVE
ncbi:hypothetical protein GF356_04560 [candidate division GN15 bacterium]|nr:hypothetical protein [candidate division GN15 bacterium]